MSESVSSSKPGFLRRATTAVSQWVDSDYAPGGAEAMRNEPDRIDWMRCLPFIFLHLGCLGVIWTGWSATAAWVAFGLYFFRMFAVTGIYHRYFSHKSYHTSRFGQFLLAVFGGTTVQRGALWWAYHHRHHHQHSDEPEDAHSPHVHGFWWSHIGWITSRRNFPTDYSKVKDLAKFPELVFLNRFDLIVPLLFAGAIYGAGVLLHHFAPGLGVTGPQLLVWGFFISTTALFHGTACINSLTHLMGARRFKTTDDSRNSFILAIVTLGEGWHNNHHRYMSSTRQGFYWWEIDITYYMLKGLASVGFIWGLKPVPHSIYQEAVVTPRQPTAGHQQYSSLRKAVPIAAGLAVATVNVAHAPSAVAAEMHDQPAPTAVNGVNPDPDQPDAKVTPPL